MKKNLGSRMKKLQLNVDTLRTLSSRQLRQVGGGQLPYPPLSDAECTTKRSECTCTTND